MRIAYYAFVLCCYWYAVWLATQTHWSLGLAMCICGVAFLDECLDHSEVLP